MFSVRDVPALLRDRHESSRRALGYAQAPSFVLHGFPLLYTSRRFDPAAITLVTNEKAPDSLESGVAYPSSVSAWEDGDSANCWRAFFCRLRERAAFDDAFALVALERRGFGGQGRGGSGMSSRVAGNALNNETVNSGEGRARHVSSGHACPSGQWWLNHAITSSAVSSVRFPPSLIRLKNPLLLAARFPKSFMLMLRAAETVSAHRINVLRTCCPKYTASCLRLCRDYFPAAA